MTLRRATAFLFLVGTIAAASGIDVRATYGAQVTADEPQYLITAISLAEDRSLDVSDEIAHRAYEPFHEVTLDRQTETLEDGREVSPHDPLLPALLAVPMEIGGWRLAKFALCLMNGALAAAIAWVAVRRFSVNVRTAALVAGVFAASAPFVVYGNQVYPELPAALALTGAIGAIAGPLRRAGVWASGLSIVVLPWLSVKYAPVAATLGLVALVRLWRRGESASAAWLAGGLTLAGITFVAAHLAWYGGVTPYAAGDHFVSTGEFGVVGTDVDLLGRSRRLIGLMVDDKFGLAAWQPAFLLAIPAMAALLRVRPPRWTLIAAPAAVGWLGATFVALTMQGWWWPGRQVVVILPVLVLAISWWADRARVRLWVVGLGLLGVASYLWLVVEGLQGRLTWVVDPFTTRNPFYRVWGAVLPDYLDVTGTTWVLHGLWIALATGLALWGWVSVPDRRSPTTHHRRREPRAGPYSTSNSVRIPSSK